MENHLFLKNLRNSCYRALEIFTMRDRIINILLFLFIFYSAGVAQSISSSHAVMDAAVTGKIINRESVLLGKKINLQTDQNTYPDIELNGDGTFAVELPENFPLRYRLFDDKDFLNGINVGDIIKIHSYILGKNPINDPLSLIAADVNRSGKVTVADIVEIRRLILGKVDQFQSGDSWIFIDAEFPLFINNWELANTYVNPNTDNSFYNEFLAVKVGDVDRIIFSRSDDVYIRDPSSKSIAYLTRDQGRIMLWLDKTARHAEGIQLGLNLDFGLQFTSCNPMLDDDQYSFSKDGKSVKIVLLNDEIEALYDKPIFIFDDYTLNNDQEPIKLSEDFENMIISNGESFSVAPIGFKKLSVSASYPSPNPFRDNTVISFKSEVVQDVKLEVYNLNGCKIYNQNINALPGQNTVSLTRTALNERAGVYYYNLFGKDIHSQGRIILLD